MNATDNRQAIEDAMRLHRAGQREAALTRLRDLQAAAPADIGVRYVLGALEFEAGRPAAAVGHLEAVVDARPGHGEAAALLGSIYRTLGRYEKAVALWRRYRRLRTDDVGVRLRLIEALLLAGQHEEADREVASLAPTIDADADGLAGVGILYHAAERYEQAVDHYRRALALRPDHPETRQNLAAALHAGGDLDGAETLYRELLATAPRNVQLLRNFATLLKDRDDLGAAVEHYGRAMRIARRRLSAREVAQIGRDPANRRTTMHSLRLELEQLVHLRESGVAFDDADALIDGYRRTLSELATDDAEGRRIVLTEPQFARIGAVMQRLVHLEPAAVLAQGALNPTLDYAAIQQAYRDSGPGIVVVDDFLRPAALESLRRYLHRSTIWFGYGRIRGYCGSYMEDGFGCALLLQLATEMRARLPDIVGPHHLNQMWAYIYDQTMHGITAHADPAAVNLNFWITPDEANLDASGGGLVVSRREAPRDWDFDAYNNRPEVLESFLTDADRVVAPYRCNRMVMFNSNLVHKTDTFAFRPGFTNRRINITMLFGNR
jgi:tetratricopeptide (TPR) repeat protein